MHPSPTGRHVNDTTTTEVAADARKTIERDTAALATATDSLEESDPFADVEEDEEELEENELVLEDC